MPRFKSAFSTNPAQGVYLTDQWAQKGRQVGARWRVRVKDLVSGEWVSRCFPDGLKSAALSWGRERMADVVRGELTTYTLTVPTKDVLDSHAAKLRERGRADKHVRELERIIGLAIDAGVSDLADDRVAIKAQKWLNSLDIADRTRARYKTHLIAIGRQALKLHHKLGRDPFLALEGASSPLPPPPVFTLEECAKLVSDRALAHSSGFGLAIAVMLYSGVRLRECGWLRWDRIDLKAGRFDVVPPTAEERGQGYAVKRNRGRTVPIQKELGQILDKAKAAAGEGAVYVFNDKIRLGHAAQQGRYFRAVCKVLDIDLGGEHRKDEKGEDIVSDSRRRQIIGARHIHSLRHSHACVALASGEDGLRLRLYLGHAGEEMTAHYSQTAMRLRSQVHEWEGVWSLRAMKGSTVTSAASSRDIV